MRWEDYGTGKDDYSGELSMRTIIRSNVFETNSSSMHTLTFTKKDKYKDWENGKMFFDEWNEKLITRKEALERALKKYNMDCLLNGKDTLRIDDVSESEQDELIKNYAGNVCTMNEYFDDDELESYDEEYTPEGSDVTVVAFGKYGFDG